MTTTILLCGRLRALSFRYRALERSCVFQAIARISGATALRRAAIVGVMRAP
jgi:hypothetical protein